MDPSEPLPKVRKRQNKPSETAKESRSVMMDRDTYERWCSAARARGFTPEEFAPVLLQMALHSAGSDISFTAAKSDTLMSVPSSSDDYSKMDLRSSSCTCVCTCRKLGSGGSKKCKSERIRLQGARAVIKSNEASSILQSGIEGKCNGRVTFKRENEMEHHSTPFTRMQLRSRSKVKCESDRINVQEGNRSGALSEISSGLQSRARGKKKSESYRIEMRGDGDATVTDQGLWSRDLTRAHAHVPKFKGPPPGPTTKMTIEHQEIDFFHLLFPPPLINSLVMETNNFAARCCALRRRASDWTNLSLAEMQAFLGLRVLMSILKFPDQSMYWSSDGLLQRIITQNRFEQISQHFSETCSSTRTEGHEGHNKPYFVDMVLENVNCNSRVRYKPHRDCVVAETTGKQEREDRDQIWMRVDPFNGYCSEFQIRDSNEKATVDSIVFGLTQALEMKNYIVNIGQQFTNGDLLMGLQERGILARGEISKSSKIFRSCSVTRREVLQKGNLLAYQWQDRDRNVQVMSSADHPYDACLVSKVFQGQRYSIPCPGAVLSYMDHMGSVHSSLHLRNTFTSDHLSRERWQHMFWFTVDVAIANALILMKESSAHEGVGKEMTSQHFRKNLAKQLIWGHMQNGESLALDHVHIKAEDHEQCEHSDCTTCWL